MFVQFDSLPAFSRVWVYQSIRKLTETEEAAISKILHAFTHQWAAHGQPLKSSYKILHNQFLILTADESFNQASGCSIDDSVHVVKEIDQHFKLDLFNRTVVSFLKDEKIEMLAIHELSAGLAQGFWNQNTQTFNNLVGTKEELSKNWILPANQTWLKRYLTKVVV